jgi:hypothetical protein
VNSKNVTSRSPRQFNRRATQYQAANPEVRRDSENEKVCMYLLNTFQNATRRPTLREGRLQMNGMALCLLLRIDRLGEYFLSEGVLDTEDDGVTPSKNIRSESQTAVSPS